MEREEDRKKFKRKEQINKERKEGRKLEKIYRYKRKADRWTETKVEITCLILPK
jgi:hypothetical protein